MKKICSTIFFVVLAISLANSQLQPFKYQGVLKDNGGTVLTNKKVGLKVSIMNDATVYAEEFNQTSDEFGTINLEIGTGKVLSGNYFTIDWSGENNKLKIEIDINGGRSYSLLGTSPILSVPVANYAVKSGFPAGIIEAFAGDTSQIPDGWLLCDGRAVDRTLYKVLFKAIGLNWGKGNEINSFNIPDLRGQFLRGTLGLADTTNDPDVNKRIPNSNGNKNAPGSMQVDAFQGHRHTPLPGYSTFLTYPGIGPEQNQAANAEDRSSVMSTTGDPITDGTNGIARISSETRPKNTYVNYIIKY